MENGSATIYDYLNEDGVVDIHTVRQATQNADASIDPGGKLAGIEEYSQTEFDSRLIMAPQRTQEAAAFGFAGDASGMIFEVPLCILVGEEHLAARAIPFRQV